MNEIIISQEAGKISCDFEAAKEALSKELEAYQGLIFTEDTKKEAKDTVANLRKCKKAFNDKCKEIKKEYMAPFDEFMERAGELSDMFDTPIVFINNQIDDFEKKRVEEKKRVIEETYEELVPEEWIRSYIPLSKIYNARWENLTFTAKDIKAEILAKKEDVKKAVDVIKSISLDSELVERGLASYKESLDLTSTISFITSYEKQRAEILEREKEEVRRAEEERIRREERAKIQAESVIADAIETAKEEAKEELMASLLPKVEEEEPESVYVYNIFLTASTKEALEIYMNSVGIEFSVREM